MLAGVLLAACDDTSAPVAPASRVVAVAAEEAGDVEPLCDITLDADAAPILAFPELASGSAPGPGGPRWLNVWATWCRPCVEELPMIIEWGARMRGEGAEVELVFLSADARDDVVAFFRSSYPDAPETLQIADPEALPEWVRSVGVDAGAALPIHVLTDARGRVRCVRSGAVGEDDYARMRDVIRSL